MLTMNRSMSHFDPIPCKNEACKKVFVPKTYNAIFCSADCRRVVTNKKLLDNYYKKKEKKNTKRVCETKKCTTVLSRYNKEDICERCKRERYIKRLVGWGWDEEKLRDEFS